MAHPLHPLPPRLARRSTPLQVVLVVLALLVSGCAATGSSGAPEDDDPSVSSGSAYDHTDSFHARRPTDRRPNVVMVLVDDMRMDELRYMPQTRRLLVRPGRTFINAVSPAPLCCPARASLLTGQYGHNNGVLSNHGPYGGFQALRDPQNTIGPWLRKNGYATTWHGKYLNGYGGEGSLRQPGWTEWDPLVGNVYRYTSFRFFGERTATQGYVTRELERRTNATVRRFAGPGTPFFTVVNHTAPHGELRVGGGAGGENTQRPPIPEARYADAFPRAVAPALGKASRRNQPPYPTRSAKLRPRAQIQRHFLARIRSLKSVDDSVGSLVRTLRQTGELDNTYIVFASDNGFQLGEHGFFTKNVLYRESLDVPLIIRGPGVTPGVTREVVSLVDLPATFLKLARTRPGRVQDGTPLVRFFRGGGGRGWRNAQLIQTGDGEGYTARGIQSGRYVYFLHRGGDLTEPVIEVLFDRTEDPLETTNVAQRPRYAQVLARLRETALQLYECTGPACNRRFARPPAPEPRIEQPQAEPDGRVGGPGDVRTPGASMP